MKTPRKRITAKTQGSIVSKCIYDCLENGLGVGDVKKIATLIREQATMQNLAGRKAWMSRRQTRTRSRVPQSTT